METDDDTWVDTEGEYGPKGKEYVFHPESQPDIDLDENEDVFFDEPEEDEESSVESQADLEDEGSTETEQEKEESEEDGSEDVLFENGSVVS